MRKERKEDGYIYEGVGVRGRSGREDEPTGVAGIVSLSYISGNPSTILRNPLSRHCRRAES